MEMYTQHGYDLYVHLYESRASSFQRVLLHRCLEVEKPSITYYLIVENVNLIVGHMVTSENIIHKKCYEIFPAY